MPLARPVVLLCLIALLAGCGDTGPETQEIGFGDGEDVTTFTPDTQGASAGPPRVADPQPLPGSAKQVFEHTCGTCHTLADAGTDSKVGPSLDRLAPDVARVRAAIENGGTGQSVMPANSLTERDEKRVAQYVARVAGRR